MADEVALVAERFTTLWTFVSLLARWWRHVVWVVVKILVPAEKLFLPEALITLIALVWLLIGVNQHVGFEVTLRDGCIGAQIAFEAFFSFMSLAMEFECVAIRIRFSAALALERLFRCVQLLNVNTEIRFATASGRAQVALENGLVAGVNQLVCLETVGLRKASVTYIALVGLLPSMDTEMPLELESVWTGIGTMRALIGPFASMAPHVPFQFAQLHRGVVTFRAPVRFLVSVTVAYVAYQFARGGERTVTMFTAVRLGPRVRVDVILKGCQCLEASIADGTLVRSLL